jgi:cystathionine beta-synthase
MSKPFPVVDEELPFRQLSKYLNKEIHAVVAKDRAGRLHVLTQYDVIQAV